MSTTSIEILSENEYSTVKNKDKRAFLDKLTKLGRSFWAYTEETSEANTKPFDGIL